MRTATVKINGKDIVIKEYKVKELKEKIPSLIQLVMPEDGDTSTETIVNNATQAICDVVTGLSVEDIDEAYPSEIEVLIESVINVNFQGLKKVLVYSQSLMSRVNSVK